MACYSCHHHQSMAVQYHKRHSLHFKKKKKIVPLSLHAKTPWFIYVKASRWNPWYSSHTVLPPLYHSCVTASQWPLIAISYSAWKGLFLRGTRGREAMSQNISSVKKSIYNTMAIKAFSYVMIELAFCLSSNISLHVIVSLVAKLGNPMRADHNAPQWLWAEVNASQWRSAEREQLSNQYA